MKENLQSTQRYHIVLKQTKKYKNKARGTKTNHEAQKHENKLRSTKRNHKAQKQFTEHKNILQSTKTIYKVHKETKNTKTN